MQTVALSFVYPNICEVEVAGYNDTWAVYARPLYDDDRAGPWERVSYPCDEPTEAMALAWQYLYAFMREGSYDVLNRSGRYA